PAPLGHDRLQGGQVGVEGGRSADQDVAAALPQEQVAAGAADQQVRAITPQEQVVAGTTQQCAAGAAALGDELVVTIAPVQEGGDRDGNQPAAAAAAPQPDEVVARLGVNNDPARRAERALVDVVDGNGECADRVHRLDADLVVAYGAAHDQGVALKLHCLDRDALRGRRADRPVLIRGRHSHDVGPAAGVAVLERQTAGSR